MKLSKKKVGVDLTGYSISPANEIIYSAPCGHDRVLGEVFMRDGEPGVEIFHAIPVIQLHKVAHLAAGWAARILNG